MITIPTIFFIILLIFVICLSYLVGTFCKFRSQDDYIQQLEEGIFFRDNEIKELKEKR